MLQGWPGWSELVQVVTWIPYILMLQGWPGEATWSKLWVPGAQEHSRHPRSCSLLLILFTSVSKKLQMEEHTAPRGALWKWKSPSSRYSSEANLSSGVNRTCRETCWGNHASELGKWGKLPTLLWNGKDPSWGSPVTRPPTHHRLLTALTQAKDSL